MFFKKALDVIFNGPMLPDVSISVYSFGWFTKTDQDFGHIVSHSGGWPGYTTFIDSLYNDKTIIAFSMMKFGTARYDSQKAAAWNACYCKTTSDSLALVVAACTIYQEKSPLIFKSRWPL